MDPRPNTRRVDRQRRPAPPQPPRGAKPIVIPMTHDRDDEIRHDPRPARASVAELAGTAPELFPAGFGRGYRLPGSGRPSRKLVTADGSSDRLRPGFIAADMAADMAGTADELPYPLLLAAHGVPARPLAIGLGHGEMYRHRPVERLAAGQPGGLDRPRPGPAARAPGRRRAPRRLGRRGGLSRHHRRRRRPAGRGPDVLGR